MNSYTNLDSKINLSNQYACRIKPVTRRIGKSKQLDKFTDRVCLAGWLGWNHVKAGH